MPSPTDERLLMHPAAQSQFARVVEEYQRWQAVPEDVRSPAPGWWWGPALALSAMPGEAPRDLAQRLGLPPGASTAAAAQLFLDALAGQTALIWPEQFPGQRRPTPGAPVEPIKAMP
ncbi:MAG: hypothetical protein JWQ94_2926 [Tardiphaga sp.]|jgi:hypothetical protein|nr:hypothetical protein [Tardiphaga sp.]